MQSLRAQYAPGAGSRSEPDRPPPEPVEVWNPPSAPAALADRLILRHGGTAANLVVRLCGIPMLLLGTGVLYGALRGLFAPAGEDALATVLGLGGGSILGLAGLSLATGSSGVTLERVEGTVTQWLRVLRRFPRRMEALGGYCRVSVRRQQGLSASKRKGGSRYGRSMWVYPVTLEGVSLPFLLAEPGSHEEARAKAEEIAAFLGWRRRRKIRQGARLDAFSDGQEGRCTKGQGL